MSPDLHEACGQLEQVFLASLLPRSLVSLGSASPGQNEDGDNSASSLAGPLFPEVFAAALERSGGIGLAAEFFRGLARPA